MTLQHLALLLAAMPGVLFLSLGLLWLVGVTLPERAMSRLTKAVYFLLTIVVLTLSWRMWQGGVVSLQISLGDWFTVGHYGFPLALLVDRLSLPMVGMTVVLAGIVGSFSIRYLHRDPGYNRFFLLLHLFTFGALLVFMAGSLDLLIAGWEIIGITSVLLIAFFQYRREPVRNALRVFGIYRIADLNMLVAVILAHHWFGTGLWSGLFSGDWPGHASEISGAAAGVIAVLLVFAASGKSSQGPFCGWLPRAMEGPTPSSAVFYGAIAVHAGAYLLLRVEPLIRASWIATTLVIFIGVTTAVLGTLVHRTCADAKTSLAYASQTQVGIIFAEIGLGWTTLATLHIIGHAMLRTMQFLRAPSMLHDHHRLHAAAGGHLAATGEHYDSILPRPAQLWLYRVALGRGFYDNIVDRFVIGPAEALARLLGIFEPPSISPAPEVPAGLDKQPTRSPAA